MSDLSADIDRQTIELYERVRAAHARFIAEIDSPDPIELTGDPPLIVVMPGAFHAEYRHTGADGQRVFDLANELGWPVERVEIPSLASMEKNAAILVDFLSKQRGRPIILVALSKGGADIRTALARANAAAEFADVRTWINLSGMVTGTPLIKWLRNRPIRCLGARLLMRFRGQRFADVAELCNETSPVFKQPLTIPPHLRAIHIFGFPTIADLSNDWAVRGHARLAPLGPNDGGGILLRDLLDLPGDVYPVRGADHYMNPAWDIRPVLLRILKNAAKPQAAKALA